MTKACQETNLLNSSDGEEEDNADFVKDYAVGKRKMRCSRMYVTNVSK